MTTVRRHLDTLAVVRGVGARVAATAALRRLSSDVTDGARGWWQRMSGAVTSPAVLAGALRVMPSPLAEEDDQRRLAILERERPGSLGAIRERAAAAIEAGPSHGSDGLAVGDPRAEWEPHRLARLVAIA